MAWTQEELNEIQTYLQMYDKMLISRKTVLERIGINSEEELKEVKKDIEFNNKMFSSPPSDMGGEIK